MKTTDIRRDYSGEGLNRKDLHDDPQQQFEQWLQVAIDEDVLDPTAMSLATVDDQNIPTVRIVLLKQLNQSGLQFFTDLQSRKSMAMAQNPNVAALFFWPQLSRQVRIEGTVSRLQHHQEIDYFASRPRDSQLAASASDQSQAIESRDELLQRLSKAAEKYAGLEVAKPEQWGGYHLEPHRYEFWQGRPGRLHDRFEYRRDNPEDVWSITRLQP